MNGSDLIASIGRVCTAIDNRIDWFFAYIQENKPHKKRFYFAMYQEAVDQLREIAKEEGQKYG